MFNAISLAIVSFFNMITTLCGAGEKGAKAVDELAGWAHESASTFHDESKHNRAISLEEQAFAREERKKELLAKRQAAANGEVAAIGNKSKQQAPATAS